MSSGSEPFQRPRPDPEHSLTPRRPRTLGGAVYLAVLGVSVAGVVMVVLDAWRSGLTVLGGALMCAAVARLVIPDAQAGMLGVRRKFVDVTTLLVLGSAIVVLAALLRGRPGG